MAHLIDLVVDVKLVLAYSYKIFLKEYHFKLLFTPIVRCWLLQLIIFFKGWTAGNIQQLENSFSLWAPAEWLRALALSHCAASYNKKQDVKSCDGSLIFYLHLCIIFPP